MGVAITPGVLEAGAEADESKAPEDEAGVVCEAVDWVNDDLADAAEEIEDHDVS